MQTKKYNNITETLITHKLPNGLSINIVPRTDFNKCYAMLATDYGGADRRFKFGQNWIDTPAGVAHFLEHKMFDMPYGNAGNLLSGNGASPNAFTSACMTAYHFECTDLFFDNLKILLEYVSTPYFSAESVQKEQGIIAQEIRMVEDSPGYVGYYNLLRCLYKTNPVRDSVAGTATSIAKITEKTLLHCHTVFYNPSNMTLAVVGNVEPERVVEMAAQLLPAEPGELPERDYGEDKSLTPGQKEISVKMEVSAPQFLFGSVVFPEKDGRARLRQMLTCEIAMRLLLGRSSPLFNELYADGLLNGSFDFGLDYASGTAMAIAGGESRDISALMSRLHKHISGICENGLDEALFGKVKKTQYGSNLRVLDSFSALSQALVTGAFAGYCPFDSFELIDEITSDLVAEFISGHFTEEKLALSVVNPR